MSGKKFDIGDVDAADEADMTVMANGQLTDWVWTFAGPGHDKTVAQNSRIAKEQLSRDRLKEQAQANGRKWKAPEMTPDDRLEDNIRYVMERLLRWTPITMNGEDYPFSEANVRTLLADPRKATLRQQAVEFLLDDGSFIKRSATT